MSYRDPYDFDEGDVTDGTRVCKKCGTRKPMTEFHWTGSRLHRARTCKRCADKRRIERKAQMDPDHRRRVMADGNLRRTYGITFEMFDERVAAQDGRCAICGEEFKNAWGAIQVDHCHSAGRIRGLLCFGCNTGLGKFRDSIENLLAAAAYLASPPWSVVPLTQAELDDITSANKRNATRQQWGRKEMKV